MKLSFCSKNAIKLSVVFSFMIHLSIFLIPIKMNQGDLKRIPELFVVELMKISRSNNVMQSINYSDLMNRDISEKVKDITMKNNYSKIPSLQYSFDRTAYESEFLKILKEKMDIHEYLERENLSGEFLFEIEIEGSGRVRNITTLRKAGDAKLEDYVKIRLYNITFPPHGELTLKIKVNMNFLLD
ncbi:MAG: hypothetical protein LDL13_03565 [Calditerrivibrio sp.]|nr:hypothetical protein [Calditerrivibrio sp.]